ncbi:hypothetical protein CASFOL_000041 [Castilleja foliolosa]|uniref:Late embryogenesis abundant protein LEA-2 subgroup domain-containing protein n=1 Tax=Castilleja foliolosa TaxID=1961234 RepID=A0ABD3ERH0_9LAMI
MGRFVQPGSGSGYIALIFTVFKVKDPVIQMNSVAVALLDLVSGTTTPWPGSNMTLDADFSVKNPNYESFRYQNTTTTIYYCGVLIGEARGPPGRARARTRQTMRVNVTVDVMTDRVISQPRLGSDISSELLTMSSYTVVDGRVKILMIRKHVTVRINMTVNR